MKKFVITLIVLIIIVVGVIYILAHKSSNSNTQSTNSQTQTMTGANTGSNSTTTTPPSSTSGSTTPTPSGTTGGTAVLTLNTANSPTLGTILVAANGMTLYQYALDTTNVSNCTGSCAQAWPPYTVSASTKLSLGSLLHGKISTITRPDGSQQVAYNDRPLYFFKSDSKVGDTKGNGIGGVWSVVHP